MSFFLSTVNGRYQWQCAAAPISANWVSLGAKMRNLGVVAPSRRGQCTPSPSPGLFGLGSGALPASLLCRVKCRSRFFRRAEPRHCHWWAWAAPARATPRLPQSRNVTLVAAAASVPGEARAEAGRPRPGSQPNRQLRVWPSLTLRRKLSRSRRELRNNLSIDFKFHQALALSLTRPVSLAASSASSSGLNSH